MLGEAMELHYGGHLCYGPPIEGGFYYDMSLEGRQVSSNDFPNLETLVKNIAKEKQPFERLEMKKEDLLKMFEYNKFKQRILNEKVTTPTTTVYKSHKMKCFLLHSAMNNITSFLKEDFMSHRK